MKPPVLPSRGKCTNTTSAATEVESIEAEADVDSEDSDEEEEDGIAEGFGFFDSVVKVFATTQEADYRNPWQTGGIESGAGSGVAVRDGRGAMRILTAAHCVADQTFIQVQRTGVESPDMFVATVHAVRHECDLALLAVDDDAFWEELEPTPMGSVPRHRSLILVAGFPVGGEELSITEGVVSRIEGQLYTHSNRRLLAITVDAAINSGNSGGPVFDENGNLIGIAFQGPKGSENQGEVVPPPVMHHFMEGVAAAEARGDGPSGYQGFPSAGFSCQELTNPYLRKHLGLDENTRGVHITDVFIGNTCHGMLRAGDVLTRVGDREVANNGTVGVGKYGRVSVKVAFTTFQCGETVELGVVRDGKPAVVSVVTKPVRELIPCSQYDRMPHYFVYCGLVFQPLSQDYLEAVGENYSPRLTSLFYNGKQSEDVGQVILMTMTLSDSVNVGYDKLEDTVITKVNGESIHDLKDLVEKVEKSAAKGENDEGERTEELLLRFETCDADIIIVPAPGTPDAKEANQRIMDRYKLGKDRHLPPHTLTDTRSCIMPVTQN